MSGQIDINGTWHDISNMQININGIWRDVSYSQIDIGGEWKYWYSQTTSSGAEPTYVLVDSNTTGTNNASFGSSTIYESSGSWAASKNYTLRRLTRRLLKVGSPTGTVTCKIYGNNSGLPGTLLATSTTTYDQDDIATSDADFDFDINYTVTSGTIYHLAVVSSQLNDSSNYFRTLYNASGSGRVCYYTTSWTSLDGTADIRYMTYELV